VLRSQRLRKIHPSSAMTFLECIDYIVINDVNKLLGSNTGLYLLQAKLIL